MGYARSGFDVVGVDKNPQPNYPFPFVQADAVEYASEHGHEYDVIAASPPCQVHSDLAPLAAQGHVDLIPEARAALIATGLPYVIENVEGAPLINPLTLCGSMFGLSAAGRVLKRHRLFESNVGLSAPKPDACVGRPVGGVYGDGGGGPQTRGYKFYAAESREAMGHRVDDPARAQPVHPPGLHRVARNSTDEGDQLMARTWTHAPKEPEKPTPPGETARMVKQDKTLKKALKQRNAVRDLTEIEVDE
jgi:DNA (cytosine-5)-methyltransferase 1